MGSGTGTLQSGADWTTGRNGAAVSMDGIDDYISLPPVDVTGSAMTLSAWVKNSSFATGVKQWFISKAVDSPEDHMYLDARPDEQRTEPAAISSQSGPSHNHVDRLDR